MRFLVPVYITVLAASGLHAQSAEGGPRRQVVLEAFRQPVDTPTVAIKQTQWRKGAVIGGIALGVPTLVFALGLCGDTDSGGGQGAGCVVAGTLVGTLAGAALGALIGGLFPKQADPDAQAPRSGAT